MVKCVCVPEDKAMEYLSEWRLRMAPMLGTLAGLRTEGTWGIWLSGVMGAVGVVGVWGRFGGEADGRFFDMVILETRFSWWWREERGGEGGVSLKDSDKQEQIQ